MKITKYIGEQFRKPTGLGGRLSTFVMNRMNQKQYKGTINALQLHGGETVLDIGFGNGYLLNKLAQKADCRFYGIEVSNNMIDLASKRNRRWLASGRMVLSEGDVVSLTFNDNLFDKIYSVNTVYFWSDLGKGLSEIRRVLKLGGLFVNTVYTKEFLESWSYTKYGFEKYTLEELKTAAVHNGFEVTVTALKPRKSYYFMMKKI